jgi:hypothetical protein
MKATVKQLAIISCMAMSLMLSACGSTHGKALGGVLSQSLNRTPCFITGSVAVNCAKTKAYVSPKEQSLPNEQTPKYVPVYVKPDSLATE